MGNPSRFFVLVFMFVVVTSCGKKDPKKESSKSNQKMNDQSSGDVKTGEFSFSCENVWENFFRTADPGLNRRYYMTHDASVANQTTDTIWTKSFIEVIDRNEEKQEVSYYKTEEFNSPANPTKIIKGGREDEKLSKEIYLKGCESLKIPTPVLVGDGMLNFYANPNGFMEDDAGIEGKDFVPQFVESKEVDIAVKAGDFSVTYEKYEVNFDEKNKVKYSRVMEFWYLAKDPRGLMVKSLETSSYESYVTGIVTSSETTRELEELIQNN